MLSSPSLVYLYSFVPRIVLLLILIFLTVKYTRRRLHNGILIGLITGMSPTAIMLFGPSELLPGLPMISLDRVVWPTVLATFWFKRSRGETTRLPLDWVERGFLAFIAVMLTSMITHGSYKDAKGDWNLFAIVQGYAFPSIAYFVARREAGTDKQLQSFLIGLGFISLYFVLTGIAQVFGLHQLVFPEFILDPALGVHAGRPRAIFLNASYYGLAIATSLPFLIWLYFTDRAPRRYLWPVVAALSVVPLILTFQRAAWVSGMVALGVAVIAWPKRRSVLTAVCVLCGILALLWASDGIMRQIEARTIDEDTIKYRLFFIERGLAMFRENPILGVGINRFGIELAKDSELAQERLSNAHNTWITLLAELGLIGFLLYLFPFALVCFESFQVYSRVPRNRAILGIIVAVTLAFLAMSISVEMRGNLYATALLFSLWSMTLGKIGVVSHLRERRVAPSRSIACTGLIECKRPWLQQRFSDTRQTPVRWFWAGQRRRQSRRVQSYRN
jgi:O-antigen ligase